jgi:hypothetical protein
MVPSGQDRILLAGIEDLPMNATEAGWMKSKKTLKYFREVHKAGKLSELVLHWYQLEEALGFLESVSSPATSAVRVSADPEQTPKGFPLRNRPQVLSMFFKNGHNYTKNYQLEAKSLGAEITCWWEEIKTSAHFGGPTGVYTFIVLVSWWSSLLKGRPDDELADCLCILEDADRVILSAIHNASDQPPAVSPPTESSLTVSPVPAPLAPQPRGSKRGIAEGQPPRKCLRPGTT